MNGVRSRASATTILGWIGLVGGLAILAYELVTGDGISLVGIGAAVAGAAVVFVPGGGPGRRGAAGPPAMLVAAAVLGGVSCTSVPPAEEPILVRNQTDVPLIVVPLTAALAARTDPAFELDVEENADRQVRPGEELSIGVEEITGGFGPQDDLVLFLYEVAGPTARFRTSRLTGREELERDGGRVTLVTGDLGAGP